MTGCDFSRQETTTSERDHPRDAHATREVVALARAADPVARFVKTLVKVTHEAVREVIHVCLCRIYCKVPCDSGVSDGGSNLVFFKKKRAPCDTHDNFLDTQRKCIKEEIRQWDVRYFTKALARRPDIAAKMDLMRSSRRIGALAEAPHPRVIPRSTLLSLTSRGLA